VAKRNEKLVKLLDATSDLKLGQHVDHTIDAFGDAYEYLMTMYASSAGKSGGEFFTPQEVSELLARITVVGKTEVNKVYDPACGSGSLLLKFAKVLGRDNVRQGFFGQEINLTTYNLCRINMFLHDINYTKFNIAHGDTLLNPAHEADEPFEAIVSNPPYSTRWEGDSNPLLINDERFAPAGVLAPKSKADLAFTMHMLSWLAVDGTAAIVEFPGVLYRGGAEQKIRRYLVDNNYVDAVIQLPPDLFFGTNIATCVIVLKKSKRDNSVLFIDASPQFVRSGNKNRLSDPNQQAILDAFSSRTDVDHFSRLVDSAEIAENAYNLAVSSYVERANTRDLVDITELNAAIGGNVARQHELRSLVDALISDLGAASDLNRLTERQSPRGVPFRTLASLGHRNSGTAITAGTMKRLVEADGPIRVFAGGQTIADVAEDAVPAASIVRQASIIVKSRGHIGFTYYERPFTHKSEIWSYTITDPDVDQKFIYYYLLTRVPELQELARATSVKIPQLSVRDTDRLRVPVPPLDVQREVVRILDRFSEQQTQLEAKLKAELEGRRQQYEYYRNRLLTFQERV
jgi:type I restriction enzyme M protein